MKDVLDRLEAWIARGDRAALATVVGFVRVIDACRATVAATV